MIRMIQSSSAGHAKAYFNDALLKSDYYLDDQELAGRFLGRLATRIGIEGTVDKETFYSLCDNINPKTNEHLTPRTISQRTVGYDINFHCPKSVSIIHVLSKDNHILEAFKACVHDTMLDIEADSKTRIRKAGQYNDRETGELAWAEFIHQTARPVDDSMPDMHLHAHAYVFNATWDEKEKQIKAGQFRDIKRDMPYYQERFHKRLADHLVKLGYQIKRTDKAFEIEGVPQKVIDLFSKRTDEIGRVAKEKGITDAKELDGLGARTRSKKQKGHTMTELKEAWRKQIREAGGMGKEDGGKAIRYAKERQLDYIAPEHCVDHALSYCFERASVASGRRILAAAYRHAMGREVSLAGITEAFEKDARIFQVKEANNRFVCTTKEVLAEEKRMIALANAGKGKLKPLYLEVPFIDLKGEQHEAARHVLTTPDRVSIISGRAGAGKTTMMKELNFLISQTHKEALYVAPTSEASRGVLRYEGFKEAETVAKLLLDKKLQEKLRNNVLIVDEAGLLGTKDTTSLLDLVTKRNARIVFVGDTRQHTSVVRGDALRILNTVGGIRTAEVSRIFRQKNKDYREAVQDLSEGKIKDAFEKLDKLQAIKTIDKEKPNETLVNDYLATIQQGKSALIISPTHKQGDVVTQAIREKLREAKLIGKREINVTRFVNLNLTEAEKNDSRNYNEGHVLWFNQNAKGVKRGTAWAVNKVHGDLLEIKNDEGKTTNLPIEYNKKFEVYRKTEISLSKGDKIRITREGFDVKNRRLINGQTLEVLSVSKKGNIKVRNSVSKNTYTLSKDHGHLAHAHSITSHASQGKTVDEVFISQPAATFPATDMKQFYVSVSRGKDRVHLYTDSKDELMEHASEMGERKSAIELLNTRKTKADDVDRYIRADLQRQPSPSDKIKTIEESEPSRAHYHEPEI
ncbi:MobF family relaxase [Ohtaekwangia kribbensis]|uniref:MobF family relaxase n=1 Tax=Ohtaekwangia kribbensis TaxID=688913 RepID=A0ABW3K1N7_9BACT